MRRLLVVLFLSSSLFPVLLYAAPAIQLDPSGPAFSSPTMNSSSGWEFTANTSIRVTHLGLLDLGQNFPNHGPVGDGLVIDHSIGIYRVSNSELLTSGTLRAGRSAMLIDGFRYLDTTDIVLNAGEKYVIAFYAPINNLIGQDRFHTNPSTPITVDSAISLSPLHRFAVMTGGLVLPTSTTTEFRIGPNFLFRAIPEPSTAALLLTCCVLPFSRRWRR